MIVYVLTASYTEAESITPSETYVFAGETGWDKANLYALRLIAEYVAGEWEQFSKRSVRELRELVEQGHNNEARRRWNGMSTYQLDLEDIAVENGKFKIDFKWPEEMS